MWTQRSHSVAEQNNRVKIEYESWSSLDSIWTLEQFFAMRAQKTRPNSLDMFCLATSTKRSLVSVDNIVSYLSVLLYPCCTVCRRMHSFTFSFVQSQLKMKCVHLTKCQWGISPCYCTKLTHNLFCCCCHCHDYNAKRNHDHDQQRMRQWCKGIKKALCELWPALLKAFWIQKNSGELCRLIQKKYFVFWNKVKWSRCETTLSTTPAS